MSEIFNEILSRVKLEKRLITMFQMDDYHNWVNGEYTGDKKRIEENVTYIMKVVKERLATLYPNQNFDNL